MTRTARRREEAVEAMMARVRDPEQARVRARAEKMRRSLIEFVRGAWHVLEPHRQFKENWHHRLLCRILESAARRELRKLIINIPPRSTKSRIVSVLWPAWIWTRAPGEQFLSASMSGDLALRDGRYMLHLARDPWYRKHFGDLEATENLENWGDLTGLELSPDQQAQSRFSNRAGGYRVSGSVGGRGMGEGGDFLILDDPIKASDAESPRVRQETLNWIGSTWSTRHNDPARSVDVLIMQRLHPEDPTAFLLDKWGEDKTEHVVLPMRFDPARRYTGRWGADPRTEKGELLQPDRMPEEAVRGLERVLINAEAQLQQVPVRRGAGQMSRGMIEVVDEPPRTRIGWARYWDKAGTAGGSGSATAGVLVGVHYPTGLAYIGDVVRGRWAADERERVIEQTARMDAKRFPPYGPPIFLEQEPGSGGKESVEATERRLAAHVPIRDKVSGSKAVRATPFVAQARAGNVRILDGAWNEAFVKEMESWTPDASDNVDQIDAAAGAYNKLWDHEYSALAIQLCGDADHTPREEVWVPDEDDPRFFGGIPADEIAGRFF